MPVHEWQPAHTLANIRWPRSFDSAAAWSEGSADAASSFGAGRSGVETAGTLRTYVTMAVTSDGVSFWKLRCTACAIGPNAEPLSAEWPVFRYCSRSSALQAPMPDSLSLVRLYARQPSAMPPENLFLLSRACRKVRFVWHSPQ